MADRVLTPAGDGAAAVRAALATAVRDERLRIVSALIRTTGDWELAEDALQDALARALVVWPEHGVPERPGAWLTTVARNRAVDVLRRRTTEADAARRLAVEEEIMGQGTEDPAAARPAIDDERLMLVFTCCHPSLAMDARVSLTLRTVLGLTTDEIARMFLVPEPTMQKRLVRARAKIRHAGIPYRVPPPELLPTRMEGVLAVLYLLFTEGFSATTDEVVRPALAEEAIRLTRLLVDLSPDPVTQPEVLGLLALMRLQHARHRARTDLAGRLVTLEDQDRSRWDPVAVADGSRALRAAEDLLLASGEAAGPFVVQAAIAECHAISPAFEHTDFGRIVTLYDLLVDIAPSPIVELNRAIAIAMADGPEAGLVLLDAIAASGSLTGYHLLPAARADLLRRADRMPEAAALYREALRLDPPPAEHRFLEARLAEVG